LEPRGPFFAVLGNKDLLRYIVSFQSGRKWDNINEADWMAEQGFLSLLISKYHRGERLKNWQRAAERASYSGHLDILCWLQEIGMIWIHNTIELWINATRGGQFHILDWLNTTYPLETPEWIATLLEHSVAEGRIDCIVYLTNLLDKPYPPYILLFAVRYDSVNVVQWLYSEKRNLFDVYPFPKIFRQAIKRKSRRTLKWLLSIADQHEPIELKKLDLSDVVEINDLDVVQIFCTKYNNHVKQPAEAIGTAAKNANFRMFEYLLHQYPATNTTELFLQTSVSGASRGSLDIAKFSILNIPTFNNQPSFAAVLIKLALCRSHIEIADWIWSYSTQLLTNEFGRVYSYFLLRGESEFYDKFNWLIQHGIHDNPASTLANNRIWREGVELLQLFQDHNIIDFNSSWMDGAALGTLEHLWWFHDNGYTCTTKAMDNAASTGNLEMVTFLHENRAEGCTVDAMDDAILWGHLDIVQFLYQNRSEGHSHRSIPDACYNGDYQMLEWLEQHQAIDWIDVPIDMKNIPPKIEKLILQWKENTAAHSRKRAKLEDHHE
jgi:hypothetical protein